MYFNHSRGKFSKMLLLGQYYPLCRLKFMRSVPAGIITPFISESSGESVNAFPEKPSGRVFIFGPCEPKITISDFIPPESGFSQSAAPS